MGDLGPGAGAGASGELCCNSRLLGALGLGNRDCMYLLYQFLELLSSPETRNRRFFFLKQFKRICCTCGCSTLIALSKSSFANNLFLEMLADLSGK